MKKGSKINRLLSCNKLLKWIFRNSSIGYKSMQSDTTSVNSLSLLIDVNSGNLKVIENQFKDKQPANKSRFARKKRKNSRKSVDQQAGMFKSSNCRRKFTLKNDFTEQGGSKEDYLNRLWNPTKCRQIDNSRNTVSLLEFDSNFDSADVDQRKPAYPPKHKPSDIVNMLLGLKECSICENELVELDSPLEIMPCQCIFHLYCISSHLLWKKICPFCYTLFSKKQITTYTEKWKSRYWLS